MRIYLQWCDCFIFKSFAVTVHDLKKSCDIIQYMRIFHRIWYIWKKHMIVPFSILLTDTYWSSKSLFIGLNITSVWLLSTFVCALSAAGIPSGFCCFFRLGSFVSFLTCCLLRSLAFFKCFCLYALWVSCKI